MTKSVKVILHRHNLLTAKEAAEVSAAEKSYRKEAEGANHSFFHHLKELSKKDVMISQELAPLEGDEVTTEDAATTVNEESTEATIDRRRSSIMRANAQTWFKKKNTQVSIKTIAYS